MCTKSWNADTNIGYVYNMIRTQKLGCGLGIDIENIICIYLCLCVCPFIYIDTNVIYKAQI